MLFLTLNLSPYCYFSSITSHSLLIFFFFLFLPCIQSRPIHWIGHVSLWVPSKGLTNLWFHLMSSCHLPFRCTWGLKCSISIGAAMESSVQSQSLTVRGEGSRQSLAPCSCSAPGPAVSPVHSVLGGTPDGSMSPSIHEPFTETSMLSPPVYFVACSLAKWRVWYAAQTCYLSISLLLI